MINLSTDITKLLQLESLNVSAENNNKEASKVASHGQEKEPDEATKVSISEQALNKINEIMSEEDVITLKISKAQTIYNSLTDIRLKLKDLLQVLKDPEMNFEVNALEKMDSMSNSLIESVISTVRNNDNMNIVSPDFLNIYIGGLKSLKQLSFLDDDFLSKIQSIEDNVKAQENEYFKATESLYSKYVDITKKYENLVNENFGADNKNLDKQIVDNAKQTLASTTANISPEAVIRLLQG